MKKRIVMVGLICTLMCANVLTVSAKGNVLNFGEEYYVEEKENSDDAIDASVVLANTSTPYINSDGSFVRRRITIGSNSKLNSRLTPIRPRGLTGNRMLLSA